MVGWLVDDDVSILVGYLLPELVLFFVLIFFFCTYDFICIDRLGVIIFFNLMCVELLVEIFIMNFIFILVGIVFI